jgi:alpha-glucoside transport system substrate-binding protein
MRARLALSGVSTLKVLAVVTAVAVLTSACLSASESGGGAAEDDDKKITIWTSMDQPVVDGLQQGLDRRLAGTGITATFSKVENINQLIMTKIQANDVPDVALIPQPGVVGDIVERGKAIPLDDVLDTASLKASMVPGTLDSGTVDGKLYGLLVSMNAKSFVFYPKKAWTAAGYSAPRTIGELNTLTEKIKADGTAPWCLGIGADAATGWPATDWFEDLVMRYGGPDQYNQWVRNEIKFDSPLVRRAAAEFERIAFTDGNVLGGRKSIASNGFGTAGNAMFDAEPGCMMYKQGSFITTFFPAQVQADLDNQVGVFGFPPAEAGGQNPLLGGGDLAVLLRNTPSGQKVMQALAATDLGDEAAAASNFMSPHKDFDVTKYKGTLAQEIAKITYGTTGFLFDGSDQMPGAVGAGAFWKELTAWISGQTDLDTALKNIDASWPAG